MSTEDEFQAFLREFREALRVEKGLLKQATTEEQRIKARLRSIGIILGHIDQKLNRSNDGIIS